MGRPHHLVARLHVGPVRYVPFMPVPFRVDELTFNDGSVVQTGDADIVVVLGPNNSGKSRTLQETNQHLALNPGQVMAPQEFVVVPALRVARELDEEGVSQWLREHRYTWTEPSNLVENFRTAQGASNSFTDVPHHWLAPDRIGFLAQHLVRALWCGERLGYLASPQKLNPGVHPEHAIHWLVRSPALMQAFRDSFKDAFGMNVIVDAWGNNIFLRVSEQESQEDFSTTSADGFADEELFERLGRLQTIDAQSDGVRSFSGIVLTLLAGQYPLVLLDEPEAFLHPPQARLLGKSLATLQRAGQLFVATHSLDILLGLISADPDRVKIIRLTRRAGVTTPRVLEPSQLATLWSDPLLRFSRALDGLFHDGVVVCEGDTDSQFYQAVADEHDLAGGRHVMFTYAGGKQRIPLVAAALEALGVPVRAAVDFDALRDEETVRRLIESVGSDFDENMKRERDILAAQLRGHEAALSVKTVKEKLSEALGADDEALVDRGMRTAVEQALEQDAGWPAAKRSGTAAVPAGHASAATAALIARLRHANLFVVPSGAVESFVRVVGGHGPRWVGEVVEGGHVARAIEARDFVRSLVGSLPGGTTN